MIHLANLLERRNSKHSRKATSMAMEKSNQQQEKRHRSIFDLPTTILDSSRLLPSASSSSSSSSFANLISETKAASPNSTLETLDDSKKFEHSANTSLSRWSCNTCKSEFDSLQDQRSHFKSDVHRFNVKLSIAGKGIVKEEDFDELTADSLFKDYDISSISGSEDEADKRSWVQNHMDKSSDENVKQKLFIQLQTGEKVSVWKCLVLDESENILYENDPGCCMPCLKEKDVIEKLKSVIREPRDNTHLRVVLLASGGHFAGCVFDGNSVVAHKTFHRYVVRAKAGKKQSSKDASGRAAHSAGASLRRYNELALKKEIQELLASWKPYFDASSCIFIYAPSNNRQLLFNGEKAYFSNQTAARNVPLTVRRPTFKEARRIYNQLTQVAYDIDERESPANIKDDSLLRLSTISIDSPESSKVGIEDNLESREATEACSSNKKSDDLPISSESEHEFIGLSTPLHEAAKSGDCHKVLELLEQGLDPCINDERGRTPYMLATEKEVRNTFRRFMASNLDKWDWHAAKVPSALTKEMEESQAAKQADKDAKRKARSKELKKLRKAKEKKAQDQAVLAQNSSTVSQNQGANLVSVLKGQPQSSSGVAISREEELKRAAAAEREKRAAAAEREKRAAAAERRIAAAASLNAGTTIGPTDKNCSYCNASLAGKIPFHRYNYKYCSTTCMHVHKEILEDG